LKRTIEQKLDNLYKTYREKQRSTSEVEPFKKINTSVGYKIYRSTRTASVTYLNRLTRF